MVPSHTCTSCSAISHLHLASSCLTPWVVLQWLFQPCSQTQCQWFPWPGLVWCPHLCTSTDSTPEQGLTSLALALAFRAVPPFVYGTNAQSTSLVFVSVFRAAPPFVYGVNAQSIPLVFALAFRAMPPFIYGVNAQSIPLVFASAFRAAPPFVYGVND